MFMNQQISTTSQTLQSVSRPKLQWPCADTKARQNKREEDELICNLTDLIIDCFLGVNGRKNIDKSRKSSKIAQKGNNAN